MSSTVDHLESDLIEVAFTQSGRKLLVDREKGVVHGVKVLGSISRNGNIYTAQAMEDAAGLYEGVAVYDGHHTRRYSDRVGVLKNATYDGKSVFADLHLKQKHSLYEQLMYDSEHDPGSLALSHEVLDGNFQYTIVPEGRRVDRISKVDAVAVVTDGGTNRSLVEENKSMSTEIKTVEQLEKAYPELVSSLRDSLVEEAKVAQKDSEKMARVIQERDEAISQRDELKGKLDLIEEERKLEELRKEILEEAKGLGIADKDISSDLMEEFLGGMKREMVTRFLKNMKPSVEPKKPESDSGSKTEEGESVRVPFYAR